jgi:uncharacterized protein
MVTEGDIQALADKIAAQFHPERIVLFGSYARGTPHEDSDIDLLVVMDVDRPRYKLAGKIRAALTAKFPIDVVVRSPEDYAASSLDLIVRDALESGRVLYSKAA